MSFLQFLRGDVENVMSGVEQQKQIVSNTLDSIKSLVPRVLMSWIGGDAEEFQADVMRKIVPAMLELIAAIAGVNLNLTKAVNIIDQADSKVKSLADGVGDLFSGIC